MGETVRVRLVGDEAQFGRIAAGDVARLFLGLERAIARAAGHALGRQVKPTGRRGRVIEDATHLRLVAIEKGSVIGVLALPDRTPPTEEFELGDTSLGETALEIALATAGGDTTSYADVAEALVQLVDEIGVGSRFSALTLTALGRGGTPEIVLDADARDRLRGVMMLAPETRDDSLIAVLVEADFEANTARLRTAAQEKVYVHFAAELADDVQEALRRQAEFRGEVSYDPKTLRARAVELRRIDQHEQIVLDLESADFWKGEDLTELAETRGIEPVVDLEALRINDPETEVLDRFFAALDEM